MRASLPELSGELLIARGSSVVERDLGSGREQRLFTLDGGRYVTFPAWSPGGDSFAYIENIPFERSGSGWGSDLFLADRKGKTRRLLLQHAAPGAQLSSPSWTPDGRTIVYADLRITTDPRTGAPISRDDIRRLDVPSGEVTTLLSGGLDPALCSDGSRIAYVEQDPVTDTRAALAVAGLRGEPARRIVIGASGLVSFYAPQFSPDCRTIVFAAVAASSQSGAVATRWHGTGLSGLPHRLAAIHGSPWDLWSVRDDGSELRRLTRLNEDMPFAACSAAGDVVLFIGTGGLYVAALDGTEPRRIAEGAEHGQISWLQN